MKVINTPANLLRRKGDLPQLRRELQGLGIRDERLDRIARSLQEFVETSCLDPRLSTNKIHVIANTHWEDVYARAIGPYREHLRRETDGLGVLFIDLNDLRKYNKRIVDEVDLGYGHDQGDMALRTVAEVLSRPLGSEDRLLRRSGDEFIVLRVDMPTQELLSAVGKNYASSFNKARVLQHPNISNIGVEYKPGCDYRMINVSIGGAQFPAGGESLDTLLVHAEKAMNSAKARGKQEHGSHFAMYSRGDIIHVV